MNNWSFNNDNSHFAGNEQKLRERTPEKVRLQTASENRRKWCGRYVARQVVPGAGSGERKSSVADSRQPCTADWQWCGQRRSYRLVLIPRSARAGGVHQPILPILVGLKLYILWNVLNKQKNFLKNFLNFKQIWHSALVNMCDSLELQMQVKLNNNTNSTNRKL